jgi:hypothetical protein
MFSKRKKSDTSNEDAQRKKELKALLRDAVDRNSAIGIVRLGFSGQDPLAQGRLIGWDDEGITIEELQVIGRDVRFTTDTRIEAFVKMKDTTIVFEGRVLSTHGLSKMNDTVVVRSIKITNPMLIRKGDRRSAFRSSITASEVETPVKMWFLDRREGESTEQPPARAQTQLYFTDLVAARRKESLILHDEDGNEPREIDWNSVIKDVQVERPHAIGRLVDLTANGLGILMYGIAKMQLTRFERVVLQFELDDQEIDLVVEVRQGNDLRGSTCKVGTLIVHPQINNVHAPQRRMLEQIAMQIQRDQLRSRRTA